MAKARRMACGVRRRPTFATRFHTTTSMPWNSSRRPPRVARNRAESPAGGRTSDRETPMTTKATRDAFMGGRTGHRPARVEIETNRSLLVGLLARCHRASCRQALARRSVPRISRARYAAPLKSRLPAAGKPTTVFRARLRRRKPNGIPAVRRASRCAQPKPRPGILRPSGSSPASSSAARWPRRRSREETGASASAGASPHQPSVLRSSRPSDSCGHGRSG